MCAPFNMSFVCINGVEIFKIYVFCADIFLIFLAGVGVNEGAANVMWSI